MFENIAYIGLGFAAVFLGLELAWQINKALFLQTSWLTEIAAAFMRSGTACQETQEPAGAKLATVKDLLPNMMMR